MPHLIKKYVRVDDRWLVQAEFQVMPSGSTSEACRSQYGWFQDRHLQEILQLLKGVLVQKVNTAKEKGSSTKLPSADTIITGTTVRFGYNFKKKLERQSCLVSSFSVGEDSPHWEEAGPQMSTLYIYCEKLIVIACSLEPKSPQGMSQLVRALHEGGETPKGGVKISSYFRRLPADSRSTASPTSSSSSTSGSQCSITTETGCHDKKTAIRNILKRSGAVLSRKRKNNRRHETDMGAEKCKSDSPFPGQVVSSDANHNEMPLESEITGPKLLGSGKDSRIAEETNASWISRNCNYLNTLPVPKSTTDINFDKECKSSFGAHSDESAIGTDKCDRIRERKILMENNLTSMGPCDLNHSPSISSDHCTSTLVRSKSSADQHNTSSFQKLEMSSVGYRLTEMSGSNTDVIVCDGGVNIEQEIVDDLDQNYDTEQHNSTNTVALLESKIYSSVPETECGKPSNISEKARTDQSPSNCKIEDSDIIVDKKVGINEKSPIFLKKKSVMCTTKEMMKKKNSLNDLSFSSDNTVPEPESRDIQNNHIDNGNKYDLPKVKINRSRNSRKINSSLGSASYSEKDKSELTCSLRKLRAHRMISGKKTQCKSLSNYEDPVPDHCDQKIDSSVISGKETMDTENISDNDVENKKENPQFPTTDKSKIRNEGCVADEISPVDGSHKLSTVQDNLSKKNIVSSQRNEFKRVLRKGSMIAGRKRNTCKTTKPVGDDGHEFSEENVNDKKNILSEDPMMETRKNKCISETGIGKSTKHQTDVTFDFLEENMKPNWLSVNLPIHARAEYTITSSKEKESKPLSELPKLRAGCVKSRQRRNACKSNKYSTGHSGGNNSVTLLCEDLAIDTRDNDLPDVDLENSSNATQDYFKITDKRSCLDKISQSRVTTITEFVSNNDLPILRGLRKQSEKKITKGKTTKSGDPHSEEDELPELLRPKTSGKRRKFSDSTNTLLSSQNDVKKENDLRTSRSRLSVCQLLIELDEETGSVDLLPVEPELSDCVLLEKISDQPKIKDEKEVETRNDIRCMRDISELGEEHIQHLVLNNENYLRQIFQGKTLCKRHEQYKEGGQRRKDLNYQVHLGLFSDEQHDVVMEMLIFLFCKRHHQYLDYLLKVLLPEMLIKIYMEIHGTDYDESNQRMAEALHTPGNIDDL
ncbi:hypothetical protein ScPMuIL_014686 [Solemya velum]